MAVREAITTVTDATGTPPSGRAPAGTTGRPGPLPTIAAAVALFFVAFEFLAFELRSGNDPSLGAATASGPQIVRKVLRTKVVTDVSSGASGGGGTTVSSAPVVTSVPAPASTPVVTSSS